MKFPPVRQDSDNSFLVASVIENIHVVVPGPCHGRKQEAPLIVSHKSHSRESAVAHYSFCATAQWWPVSHCSQPCSWDESWFCWGSVSHRGSVTAPFAAWQQVWLVAQWQAQVSQPRVFPKWTSRSQTSMKAHKGGLFKLQFGPLTVTNAGLLGREIRR